MRQISKLDCKGESRIRGRAEVEWTAGLVWGQQCRRLVAGGRQMRKEMQRTELVKMLG